MAAVSRNKNYRRILGRVGSDIGHVFGGDVEGQKTGRPSTASEGYKFHKQSRANSNQRTVIPPTNSPPVTPSTPTSDPLLRALQQKGNLKTALESLAVDHGFDAEGNLLWLGLGSLAVTDEALAKLAGETNLHALYLYDTKITDAGLKHLAGLTGLRLLLITATPVTDTAVAELEEPLCPNAW